MGDIYNNNEKNKTTVSQAEQWLVGDCPLQASSDAQFSLPEVHTLTQTHTHTNTKSPTQTQNHTPPHTHTNTHTRMLPAPPRPPVDVVMDIKLSPTSDCKHALAGQ